MAMYTVARQVRRVVDISGLPALVLRFLRCLYFNVGTVRGGTCRAILPWLAASVQGWCRGSSTLKGRGGDDERVTLTSAKIFLEPYASETRRGVGAAWPLRSAARLLSGQERLRPR